MKKHCDFRWLSLVLSVIANANKLNIRHGIVTLGAVVLLAGCSSYQSDNSLQVLASVRTNSVTAETIAAGEYLHLLHKEGRLPGDSKDDRGEMTTDKLPLSEFKEVGYPFSRTFHVVKKGDPSTYHYTVGRQSKELPWQLERAWRTDTEGKMVEEWPVK